MSIAILSNDGAPTLCWCIRPQLLVLGPGICCAGVALLAPPVDVASRVHAVVSLHDVILSLVGTKVPSRRSVVSSTSSCSEVGLFGLSWFFLWPASSGDVAHHLLRLGISAGPSSFVNETAAVALLTFKTAGFHFLEVLPKSWSCCRSVLRATRSRPSAAEAVVTYLPAGPACCSAFTLFLVPVLLYLPWPSLSRQSPVLTTLLSVPCFVFRLLKFPSRVSSRFVSSRRGDLALVLPPAVHCYFQSRFSVTLSGLCRQSRRR